MLIIDEPSPEIALPGLSVAGDVLVFDGSNPSQQSDLVSGEFIVFDGIAAITTVVVPSPEFVLVDGAIETVASLDTGQTDFVVITSGGPQGVPGPVGPSGADPRLDIHIQADSPHPKYDDLPSLTLLFENGLV